MGNKYDNIKHKDYKAMPIYGLPAVTINLICNYYFSLMDNNTPYDCFLDLYVYLYVLVKYILILELVLWGLKPRS